MTPAEWDHVITVNLSGAFYLSRAILQHMLDRGYGRIARLSRGIRGVTVAPALVAGVHTEHTRPLVVA